MSLTDRLEQARRSQPMAPNGQDSPKGESPEATRLRDPFARVKASVHQALMDSLGPQLYDPHLEQSELELRVRQTLQSVINSENTPLSAPDRNRIAQEVADEILGLGPLEPLLRDGEITEIMVNGPNDIFVERSGKIFAVMPASPVRCICGGRSTRSSAGWAAGSTRALRWWTLVWGTAHESTRSSRLLPWMAAS